MILIIPSMLMLMKKIKAFCEENGIENMLQKPKEKKRTER